MYCRRESEVGILSLGWIIPSTACTLPAKTSTYPKQDEIYTMRMVFQVAGGLLLATGFVARRYLP
jgi:hypothetical protein